MVVPEELDEEERVWYLPLIWAVFRVVSMESVEWFLSPRLFLLDLDVLAEPRETFEDTWGLIVSGWVPRRLVWDVAEL